MEPSWSSPVHHWTSMQQQQHSEWHRRESPDTGSQLNCAFICLSSLALPHPLTHLPLIELSSSKSFEHSANMVLDGLSDASGSGGAVAAAAINSAKQHLSPMRPPPIHTQTQMPTQMQEDEELDDDNETDAIESARRWREKVTHEMEVDDPFASAAGSSPSGAGAGEETAESNEELNPFAAMLKKIQREREEEAASSTKTKTTEAASTTSPTTSSPHKPILQPALTSPTAAVNAAAAHSNPISPTRTPLNAPNLRQSSPAHTPLKEKHSNAISPALSKSHNSPASASSSSSSASSSPASSPKRNLSAAAHSPARTITAVVKPVAPGTPSEPPSSASAAISSSSSSTPPLSATTRKSIFSTEEEDEEEDEDDAELNKVHETKDIKPNRQRSDSPALAFEDLIAMDDDDDDEQPAAPAEKEQDEDAEQEYANEEEEEEQDGDGVASSAPAMRKRPVADEEDEELAYLRAIRGETEGAQNDGNEEEEEAAAASSDSDEEGHKKHKTHKHQKHKKSHKKKKHKKHKKHRKHSKNDRGESSDEEEVEAEKQQDPDVAAALPADAAMPDGDDDEGAPMKSTLESSGVVDVDGESSSDDDDDEAAGEHATSTTKQSSNSDSDDGSDFRGSDEEDEDVSLEKKRKDAPPLPPQMQSLLQKLRAQSVKADLVLPEPETEPEPVIPKELSKEVLGEEVVLVDDMDMDVDDDEFASDEEEEEKQEAEGVAEEAEVAEKDSRDETKEKEADQLASEGKQAIDVATVGAQASAEQQQEQTSVEASPPAPVSPSRASPDELEAMFKDGTTLDTSATQLFDCDEDALMVDSTSPPAPSTSTSADNAAKTNESQTALASDDLSLRLATQDVAAMDEIDTPHSQQPLQTGQRAPSATKHADTPVKEPSSATPSSQPPVQATQLLEEEEEEDEDDGEIDEVMPEWMRAKLAKIRPQPSKPKSTEASKTDDAEPLGSEHDKQKDDSHEAAKGETEPKEAEKASSNETEAPTTTDSGAMDIDDMTGAPSIAPTLAASSSIDSLAGTQPINCTPDASVPATISTDQSLDPVQLPLVATESSTAGTNSIFSAPRPAAVVPMADASKPFQPVDDADADASKNDETKNNPTSIPATPAKHNSTSGSKDDQAATPASSNTDSPASSSSYSPTDSASSSSPSSSSDSSSPSSPGDDGHSPAVTRTVSVKPKVLAHSSAFIDDAAVEGEEDDRPDADAPARKANADDEEPRVSAEEEAAEEAEIRKNFLAKEDEKVTESDRAKAMSLSRKLEDEKEDADLEALKRRYGVGGETHEPFVAPVSAGLVAALNASTASPALEHDANDKVAAATSQPLQAQTLTRTPSTRTSWTAKFFAKAESAEQLKAQKALALAKRIGDPTATLTGLQPSNIPSPTPSPSPSPSPDSAIGFGHSFDDEEESEESKRKRQERLQLHKLKYGNPKFIFGKAAQAAYANSATANTVATGTTSTSETAVLVQTESTILLDEASPSPGGVSRVAHGSTFSSFHLTRQSSLGDASNSLLGGLDEQTQQLLGSIKRTNLCSVRSKHGRTNTLAAAAGSNAGSGTGSNGAATAPSRTASMLPPVPRSKDYGAGASSSSSSTALPSLSNFAHFNLELKRQQSVKALTRVGSFLTKAAGSVGSVGMALKRSLSEVGGGGDEDGATDFSAMLSNGSHSSSTHKNAASSSMGGMSAAKRAATKMHASKAFVFRKHDMNASRDGFEMEKSLGAPTQSGSTGNAAASSSSSSPSGPISFGAFLSNAKRAFSNVIGNKRQHPESQSKSTTDNSASSSSNTKSLLQRLTKKQRVA